MLKCKRETRKATYRLLHVTRCARPFVGAALAVSLVVLAGCAAVTTADGSRLPVASDRFAAYAERVFREQNRVATELAFALEDTPGADSTQFAALESAEEALLTACAGLNEVAAARRDGESPGVRRGLRAARQAPVCERATVEAAAVLERTAR